VLSLAGQETIFRNFDQSESGVLDFVIAGDEAGQYGALTVTGNATLFGELALDLTHGFELSAGDGFDLMRFGAGSEDFSGVSVDKDPLLGDAYRVMALLRPRALSRSDDREWRARDDRGRHSRALDLDAVHDRLSRPRRTRAAQPQRSCRLDRRNFQAWRL
jgi:hypothetical protein